ncbi:MAG: NUDIX domain-containing protein [Planctomycetota bacterium]
MSGPSNGPRVRTDIVDVYVFRRGATDVSLLQLLRARDPLGGTWQPVMGHVEAGERAVDTVWRELGEEVGLRPPSGVVGAWALEQVHPFFLADRDEIIMSPRFAVEVERGWEPELNDEHEGARWVSSGDEGSFMWPGQRAAVRELLRLLDDRDSAAHEPERHLRLPIPGA